MTRIKDYDFSTAKENFLGASPEDTFVFPASFAQERLWFLDQREPGSSTYNVPANFRLTGPLNVVVLEQSVTKILERHESLRTTFTTMEGRLVQRITSSAALSLKVVDLLEIPEAEREAKAQRLITEEAQRPFYRAEGP